MKRYQHVSNNFMNKEVSGLLSNETVLIQPKLDGSNCQMYLENDEIVITSRERILSLNSDNSGCYNTLIRDERYKKFFNDFPTIKLCGEWLISHKVKYREDAYKKFYVFDGIHLETEDDDGRCQYICYDSLKSALNIHNIQFLPYMILKTEEFKALGLNIFKEYSEFCNYLVDTEHAQCEGIVVKNYHYKNPFGRSVWCKLINEEWYKIKNSKPKERTIIDKTQEQSFIDTNLTEHLLSKCFYKISDFDKSKIGEYIKSCQAEFQEDFINNQSEVFNIKVINNIIAVKARDYLVSINKLG